MKTMKQTQIKIIAIQTQMITQYIKQTHNNPTNDKSISTRTP